MGSTVGWWRAGEQSVCDSAGVKSGWAPTWAEDPLQQKRICWATHWFRFEEGGPHTLMQFPCVSQTQNNSGSSKQVKLRCDKVLCVEKVSVCCSRQSHTCAHIQELGTEPGQGVCS